MRIIILTGLAVTLFFPLQALACSCGRDSDSIERSFQGSNLVVLVNSQTEWLGGQEGNVRLDVLTAWKGDKSIRTIDYHFGQEGSMCELFLHANQSYLLFLRSTNAGFMKSKLYATTCDANLLLVDELDETIALQLDALVQAQSGEGFFGWLKSLFY